MNDSRELARQMDLALNGGAWHGPSWKELLDGVAVEAATRRPITGAHSIAEIVLHATTWHDVVRRRMEGESPQVSDDEDWPKVPARPDSGWWSEAVRRLLDSGTRLTGTVRAFPAERLPEARPGVDDNWYGLIMGELQHILYHAGQVALLRKAQD